MLKRPVTINTPLPIFTSESESPLAYKWTNLLRLDETTENNQKICLAEVERGTGRVELGMGSHNFKMI